MTTCLITGGAGFIGSHLATRFVEIGWKVRVFDNLISGKRANLAHLPAGSVEFIEGDIVDQAALLSAFKGVDLVFHHAAMVSVPQSVKDPVGCHARCATGTLNVLMAAKEAGVKRVVYAASSSAYGGVVDCPIDENAPIRALSPYAAGKLAGEHYCSAFAEIGAVETVRLRYFNVFGPRQDPTSPYSGVISIFATKLLKGESPMIFGDGQQSRDFVYVANVVQANYLAATTAGVSGEVFNIGCGGKITLIDLLREMNNALGTRVEAKFADPRIGDVRDSQANIVAARTKLGYDPKVSFAEGLKATLDYYKTIV